MSNPLDRFVVAGNANYHTHAKDTVINKPIAALTNRLENGSLMDIPRRSWSWISLGYGNGESWRHDFCYRLRMAGNDGWLSIEHEDVLLGREEGVQKSVNLLLSVTPVALGDYKLHEFQVMPYQLFGRGH